MIDFTGKRVGSQTVTRFLHRSAPTVYWWLCRCDCGNERPVTATSLRAGTSKSCGCGIRKSAKITHGISGSREWRAWAGMKQRCLSKKWRFYYNYGGRGLRICAFILESPLHLKIIIGESPGQGWSVDRKDNSGHYSCGSCAECRKHRWPMNLRWATAKQQCNNRRKPRKRIKL